MIRRIHLAFEEQTFNELEELKIRNNLTWEELVLTLIEPKK